jgi:hypothetical protein
MKIAITDQMSKLRNGVIYSEIDDSYFFILSGATVENRQHLYNSLLLLYQDFIDQYNNILPFAKFIENNFTFLLYKNEEKDLIYLYLVPLKTSIKNKLIGLLPVTSKQIVKPINELKNLSSNVSSLTDVVFNLGTLPKVKQFDKRLFLLAGISNKSNGVSNLFSIIEILTNQWDKNVSLAAVSFSNKQALDSLKFYVNDEDLDLKYEEILHILFSKAYSIIDIHNQFKKHVSNSQ